MTEILLLLWTIAVASAGFYLGRQEGYEQGLDHAARMIFGVPVVWP